MTQLAELPEPVVETAPAAATFHHSRNDEEEFAYQPIPMSAMVAAVLAFLSAGALFAWMAIAVAAVAAVVSLAALVRIIRSRGEFSGKWLAAGSLAASLAFGVVGVGLTLNRYRQELPPGAERISFAHEISNKGIGMKRENDQEFVFVEPAVQNLVGKRIYVKGFIYPTKRIYNLTEFVLCKDNQQCCFGGQPALTDMIGVGLSPNKTTNYTSALTGVAGTFRINPEWQPGSTAPLYLLDADYVAPALTSL